MGYLPGLVDLPKTKKNKTMFRIRAQKSEKQNQCAEYGPLKSRAKNIVQEMGPAPVRPSGRSGGAALQEENKEGSDFVDLLP